MELGEEMERGRSGREVVKRITSLTAVGGGGEDMASSVICLLGDMCWATPYEAAGRGASFLELGVAGYGNDDGSLTSPG